MKKIHTFTFSILTMIFVCLSGLLNVSNAQDAKLTYGGKAGFSLNYFYSTQPYMDLHYGGAGGGFAAFHLNENMAVQLEAMYFVMGGKTTVISDDRRFGAFAVFQAPIFTESKISLHKIYTPLLFKYKLPLDIGVPVSLQVGPDASMIVYGYARRLHTGQVNDGSGILISEESEDNVTDVYEPFDIGATAGLGFEIPAGFGTLMIDLRYRYGITPAYKGFSYIDYVQVQEDITAHSAYITVGVQL